MAINNGVPYVAFKDLMNGMKATVMKYNGTDWEVVGSVGITDGIASHLDLVFNDDTLYLAFRDDSFSAGTFGGTSVLKYDGGGWSYVGGQGFSAGEANNQSLAFYNNIPYVAYQDNSDVFKTAVMKYEGGVWVSVGSATGFSAGLSYEQSLALDQNDGTPYVAFIDGENSLSPTVMKYDGNNWVNVGLPGFTGGLANFSEIIINNGIPYLAYADNLNGIKSTVMTFDGTDWVPVGLAGFSDGGANFINFIIQNNILYVGYRDDENGNTNTVKKYDGSNWVNVGPSGFSDIGAAHQSLAIDKDNGTLYIAFQDEANSWKTTVMSFDGTSGINELGTPLDFDLSPNPAADFLQIKITDKVFTKNIQIEVIDLMGKVLFQIDLTTSNQQISTSAFSNGCLLYTSDAADE